MTETISDTREWVDQNIKGDPASASAEDQVSNKYDHQEGRKHPERSCKQSCQSFLPRGLNKKY